MRSTRYTLFHSSPRNLDDCFHYYLKRQIGLKKPEVTLELQNELYMHEGYAINVFIGRYSWLFIDGIQSVLEKVYGGYLENDSSKRRKTCTETAIARLHSDLEIISRLGIDASVRESSPIFHDIPRF